MDRLTFRMDFVAGPLLMCCIIPTIVFGVMLNEWGTNLIWGSLFGVGWCVSASVLGGLLDNRDAATAGLLWAWLVPVVLFFGSDWLWRKLNERGRKIALTLLAFSFLFDVPAKTIMSWDRHFHLPDFALHLAESY
jgi:hypothetical protein